MKIKSVETDVLVVGGGGAGFRAAIAAREKGVKVILLSKGPLARCGASPMAGADFTLDGTSLNKLGREGDLNDSKEKVFNDIVTQGYYLNNQKLVEQYIETAPKLLKNLLDYGIDISFSDQRAIFTTGTGIMDALLKQARSVDVDLMEDIMLLDLTTRDGRITGGVGLDIGAGEFIVFKAKAVVIATGGWHKGFWPNTGMRDLSGEGIAMAHRAGAEIGNMEFITFACNAIYEPAIWRGSIAPYIMSTLCGGSHTNNKGEDIFRDFDPFVVKTGTSSEWNKSFISILSTLEARAGRGFGSGCIHYSRGDVDWEEMKMWAGMLFPNWQYKGIDLTDWGKMLENNEPIEVGPMVEYFDGGIVVNEHFETGVEGLYAAGECTLGAFGASRVFSAITEMLVHGLDAGTNAGHFAREAAQLDPDPEMVEAIQHQAEIPLQQNDGLNIPGVRRKVQERAQKQLGPVRNQNELENFIGFLETIKTDELPNLCSTSKSRIYNKEWIDAIELENLVYLLESSARSALARTESRGVHFREDFPVTDNDNWLQESIIKPNHGTIEVGKRPVTITSMTPPKGVVPFFEMMKSLMQAHSDTGGHH